MIKYITILAISLFSLRLFADCGSKVTSKKNILTTYLECPKDQKNCLKLKDTLGKAELLDKTTMQKFDIKTASYSEKIIEIELVPASACLFEEVTRNNIGKKMAVVINNKIYLFPTIQAEIKGGILQITNVDGKITTQKFCKLIFSKCISKPPISASNGSFLDFFEDSSKLNKADIDKKYGSVFESMTWTTDAPAFFIYKSNKLEAGELYYPMIYSDGPKKGSLLIPLFQEFDETKNQFIHSDEAIHILDVGWVRRSDLIPLNVISDLNKKKNGYFSSLLAKKCLSLIEKLKPNELERKEIIKMQYMTLRDFEIAICAVEGEKECQNFFSEMKKELEKVDCNELEKQFK